MAMTTTIKPVIKTVEVALGAREAFTLFAERTASWWPLGKHAVTPMTDKVPAANVTIEPRVGGRIYETAPSGATHEWGAVVAYEPGERFAMTWHPGFAPAEAGQVDVRFKALDGGRTSVTLTHTGWEKRGERAQAIRDDYDQGWDGVIAQYAAAA